MVQISQQFHENLISLLGYRTTIRMSLGVSPYSLVYGLRFLDL